MRRWLAIACALALAGCVQPPQLPADVARAAAERNAVVSCASFQSLVYGSVTTIHIVLDRGVLQPGAVSVRADCAVSIKAEPDQ